MRAIYGLKSAGAGFWNHLAAFMHNLELLPFPADLGLWIKPIVRPDDGFNYYTYIFIYVDEVVVIHHVKK